MVSPVTGIAHEQITAIVAHPTQIHLSAQAFLEDLVLVRLLINPVVMDHGRNDADSKRSGNIEESLGGGLHKRSEPFSLLFGQRCSMHVE